MEQREYKRLQEDPRVFRRAELVDSIRWLGDSLPSVTDALIRILAGQPLDKPQQHAGAPESDLFRVLVTKADVSEVCGHLLSQEAAAVSPSGETTALASKIGSLVDRWSRYAESLDDDAA